MVDSIVQFWCVFQKRGRVESESICDSHYDCVDAPCQQFLVKLLKLVNDAQVFVLIVCSKGSLFELIQCYEWSRCVLLPAMNGSPGTRMETFRRCCSHMQPDFVSSSQFALSYRRCRTWAVAVAAVNRNCGLHRAESLPLWSRSLVFVQKMIWKWWQYGKHWKAEK